MKQIYFLSFLFALYFTTQLQAQNTVSYTYDQAGNRLTRTIVLANPQSIKRHQPTDSVVLKETIGELSVKVFPNPTRGALGVDIQGGNTDQALRLILLSGSGATLYNKPATIGLNPIDMSSYPSGWYILRIVVGTETKEYKIVKE